MSTKERVTITVDADLLVVARETVAAGLSDSLSAWVNGALRDRVERERRLAALAAAVSEHEAEQGEISDAEMARQRRADREAAVVVRSRRGGA